MLEWSKAIADIEKKPLEPVYTCLGSEFALVDEWVHALGARVSRDFGEPIEPVQYSYDEGDALTAIMTCQSISLFSTAQLIVLKHLWPAGAGKSPVKSKGDVEALEAYLDNPMPQNILVVLVPTEKFDERKKLTKRLKLYPVIDCTVPKEPQGKKSVERIAQNWGISLEGAATSELWRRTQSVSRAASELKKLWTYTNGRTISETDVRELVAPPIDDNIFTWIDGVVTGDVNRSFTALEDIKRSGHDAFSLYGMLVRQLRLMWYAKTMGASGYTSGQIAAQAGAHPYAVQVAMQQSKHVKAADLEELLTVVADAEYAVKSGRREPGQALDLVLASCIMRLRRKTVPQRRTS